MGSVAFLVNGEVGSAMGQRARSLAAHLSGRFDIHIAYRSEQRIVSIFSWQKILSILYFARFLARVKPRVTYVFDISYSGILGASLYKLWSGNYLIIDTGDAIYELARSFGTRGALGEWLTWSLERFSYWVADQIVVRGTFHQRLLAEQGIQAEVIRDGVETEMFTPGQVDELRQQYELDGLLAVGIVGTVVWSPRAQICAGWELVEAIRLLRHAPVKGIMIGGGLGLLRLKALCQEYGIEDKMLFLDYLAYDQLPRYLNLMDVCLLTQPNEIAYQVRTTGKLPLYLACGRYILASRIGEAALVLNDDMLVEYEGLKDLQYPQKLAERISILLDQPERPAYLPDHVALAKAEFDYSVLAEKLANLLEAALNN